MQQARLAAPVDRIRALCGSGGLPTHCVLKCILRRHFRKKLNEIGRAKYKIFDRKSMALN